MTKTEVIASVAGDLRASEQALDLAITRATTLVQAMIGARGELNLSPVVGAAALEAIAGLSAARESLVACHQELAKDHRRLGYGVYASIEDKVPEGDVRPTGEFLRAV